MSPAGPLADLGGQGQGVWLDPVGVRLAAPGHLRRFVQAYGISGVALRLEALSGRAWTGGSRGDADELYRSVLVEAARVAADALAPTHEATAGRDGLVSLALPPAAGDDADGILRECHRLRELLDRPNVVLRVPATPSGCAALEALAADGLRAHATTVYSIEQLRRVEAAHLAGLRRWVRGGGRAERVGALVSMELHPVDVTVDDLLGQMVRDRQGDTRRIESLAGLAAIAQAKVAACDLRHRADGDEWQALAMPGAGPPRPVWEAAYSRNPLHRDVRYVEELIGPDTVVALSLPALEAFRDHGVVAATLGRQVEQAREVLDDLADEGIDLDSVGRELQRRAQARRREVLEAAAPRRQTSWAVPAQSSPAQSSPPHLVGTDGPAAHGSAAATEALPGDLEARLWAKDPALWSDDPATGQRIRDRLGWLDIVEPMRDEVMAAIRFVEELESSDIEQVLLLGMGGSSLWADVARRIFGAGGFRVLDSTVPAAILEVGGSLDPARTLFVVSSKSGTTVETRALFDHFYAHATPMLARPGERFVAVTDPGTPLEQTAHERGFRRVWLAPPDIGGRYSALSWFGVVPMATMGIEVTGLLEHAWSMALACGPGADAATNPGVALGLRLASAHAAGRDKLTFVDGGGLEPFADWAEQLVAESTGKDGRGVVPVRGEPLGAVDRYGDDRIFVYPRLTGVDDAEVRRQLDALEARGHPVLRFELGDELELGAELFRWQVATAVLGACIAVDPFDEPDVQDSKERTGRLLERHRREGCLPEPAPVLVDGGIRLHADPSADEELRRRVGGNADLVGWLRGHLGRARPGDYVAVQAFLAPDRRVESRIEEMRALLRDRLGVATTFGWGPRFLHSTGQLHKGGPDTGLFLQLTADDEQDLEVPARNHSFGLLARAQALGDLQALQARGRRVVRVHLSRAVRMGVERLGLAVREALEVG